MADFMGSSVVGYEEKLGVIIDEQKLEVVWGPENVRDYHVKSSDVNRPGLALNGFYDCFDANRIQLLGNAEFAYLNSCTSAERQEKFNALCAQGIPAVIITRGLPAFEELLRAAKEYATPILRTQEHTARFQAGLIANLNVKLAPRITRHGVLVDVYGVGILIMGESGIGKSETAIELVKRGHRLIADDAVEIKRVSEKTLVGSAPDIIKHYIELRGIGIVDIQRLFGVGAVEDTEKIDLVIKLEPWDKERSYDRLGDEDERTDILGIEVPTITIPIRPGRNLAIILEIAAMESRQKANGYNTIDEFNKRLEEHIKAEQEND